MKNFVFKSSKPDLQKMFQLLETIQKNGLYCTYRLDSLLKNFDSFLKDKKLQTQVDEYFDEHHDAYEEEHDEEPQPTLHPRDDSEDTKWQYLL